MTLYVLKRKAETWREFVYRRAVDYGLEEEALDTYDNAIKQGELEAQAASLACSEWNLMYYADGNERSHVQAD